ncbi:guanylate cyclase activator 2B [Elgaria multicarinata webbii]|uniref:guanylate cyclase activator 2B n=1 Tax=Elgaria multicarinata webbii TaxID=159646 RepID=UPI002FCD2C90
MAAIVAPVIFMLLMMVQRCQAAVQVQVDGMTFPLESVKRLQELLGTDAASAHPRMRSHLTFFTACANPDLPKEFQPVCERKDAPLVFKRLDLTVRDDPCELCANIACSGC